ncbi:hypothetical protein [Clostridium sp. OS1-26]|uniref:hypothetical protein n=1 Tax=Clostridium sp. OS1-26 TaxID=3070681 RepID=UPI0027E0DF38|nr:hypothetical protein [Clostridium sp. OS1-26]WML35336.1 hypothetical protein RCG18_00800 [Clostridium sp. OS1-26]
MIKQVQRGIATTITNGYVDTTISAVSSISKCIVSTPGLESATTGTGYDCNCCAYLTSTTNLRLWCNTATAGIPINWEVAEFY